MKSLKEILVIGAGAAGMAVAIAASRKGKKVVLLEKRVDLGGIVTHGLIHTIGGLYDSVGEHLNLGLPVELAQRLVQEDKNTRKRKIGRVWVLNACPSIYKKTVEAWLKEEKNIQVISQIQKIKQIIKGKKVRAVEFTRGGQKAVVSTSVLIDCTGDANIIRSLGPDMVFSDGNQALAGLIFSLRNVRVEELTFPKNIVVQRKIQAAVSEGMLPVECSKVWLDTGVYPDEIYVKLSIPSYQYRSDLEMGRDLEIIKEKLIAFLCTLPVFKLASVGLSGQLSLRDGDRAKGEYQLTVDDVRSLRTFEDAACRCSWPIEYWDPTKGVQLEYLKNDGHYDIPLRSLKVAGFENVWVAGKCFSSDHLAQASARVSGCCWAMGEAAASAAVSE